MISDPTTDVMRQLGRAALLDGRVIVLSGAGGGIGRAMARAYAASGARLVLTDVSAEAVEAMADELRRDGHEVFAEAFDASEPGRFTAFAGRAARELGAVHGLVNCAGLWCPKPYAELDVADWRLAIAANLETTIAGCLAVLPLLARRAGGGSIVNVASTAGEYGSITPASHYAAAKGGVIALTKSLAREAAAAGVRVNAVSPGPVETAAHESTPEERARLGARTLLGRPGRPDEIAAACAFLLSDWSSYVTGHVLRVNGGALI